MIAIYIHVPFCKQACHYCNFHFSTNQSGKPLFVKALLKEISLRKDEFQNQSVASVYFGGGTPSLLNKSELEEIFYHLKTTFDISPSAEITLEANPDDINPSLLQVWRSLSINRISLGIQSFQPHALTWMNRAHYNQDALNALSLIAKAGFDNITADLIYGVPGVSDDQWISDILALTDRKIPHISAYCLTVEDQTAFFGCLLAVELETKQFEALFALEAVMLLRATEPLLAGADGEVGRDPGHQAVREHATGHGAPGRRRA